MKPGIPGIAVPPGMGGMLIGGIAGPPDMGGMLNGGLPGCERPEPVSMLVGGIWSCITGRNIPEPNPDEPGPGRNLPGNPPPEKGPDPFSSSFPPGEDLPDIDGRTLSG